jgi:hypothetical protein
MDEIIPKDQLDSEVSMFDHVKVCSRSTDWIS